jgi:hypothetical protein
MEQNGYAESFSQHERLFWRATGAHDDKHSPWASSRVSDACYRPIRWVIWSLSVCTISNIFCSTVRGIELERPRPAEGETIVRMRRETHIVLNFDMHSLSRELGAYVGLKIPSTPSVKNHDSEAGKKLLYLHIRVLGATTRTTYEALCRRCKDRVGNRHTEPPFPDFHAKSDILVPQKSGGNNIVLVAFTLACYSKDRKPNDSEYR